ncbi:MAG: LysM peptidoglycan-binding domain-containing protein [Actinomycetaceae bacterium]|nr:LysM peptidoglycan-binding domain-containing protein [Actinomycetaceae bacterium]
MSALTIPPVQETGRVVSTRRSHRGTTASRGHLYVVPDVRVSTPQRERRPVASAPVERSPKVAHRAEAKKTTRVEIKQVKLAKPATAEFNVADLQLNPEDNISWKAIAIFGLFLVVAALAIYGLISPAQAEQLTTAYVASGDSLWSIAAAHTPANGDVAEMVHQIKTLNGLHTDNIQIGQILVVPTK